MNENFIFHLLYVSIYKADTSNYLNQRILLQSVQNMQWDIDIIPTTFKSATARV